MYLDDEAPIAGGREIWGVPQKLARPKLCHESEVLVGTLHFGSVLCAMGSMGYKHQELDQAPILRELGEPSFLIKIIRGKRPVHPISGTPAFIRPIQLLQIAGCPTRRSRS